MRVFTALLAPGDALSRYRAALRLVPLGTETVPLREALDRVLTEDVVAGEDLPPFSRSTVDGYAVRASDVAGAGAAPVTLRLLGEIRMGAPTDLVLHPSECARIPTGGMLPRGADAVVMQEDAERSEEQVTVRAAAAPGQNILRRGEDVHTGEVVLPAGRRLRPQDLGILAGLGHAAVAVRIRPRVAVLSSGDEVVPAGRPVGPGQVRDMNTFTLHGLIQRAGGIPVPLPVVPDDLATVTDALRRAAAAHEMVLISGGSSVGERDVVPQAVAALGPPGVVVHGVALRPGKPAVLGAVGATPVIGLPGNPVSAMVVFDLFARPLLAELLGVAGDGPPGSRLRARAAQAMRGAGQREDHVRVRLEERADGIWAEPLPAKSGLLTTMVRADGVVVVPAGATVEAGDEVEVRLLD